MDVDAILDVYALFSRNVTGLGMMQTKGTSELPLIEAGNRIFTPKIEAPSMQPAEIQTGIDSDGFIANVNAFDTSYVYGEENVVLYGEERVDNNGNRK